MHWVHQTSGIGITPLDVLVSCLFTMQPLFVFIGALVAFDNIPIWIIKEPTKEELEQEIEIKKLTEELKRLK